MFVALSPHWHAHIRACHIRHVGRGRPQRLVCVEVLALAGRVRHLAAHLAGPAACKAGGFVVTVDPTEGAGSFVVPFAVLFMTCDVQFHEQACSFCKHNTAWHKNNRRFCVWKVFRPFTCRRCLGHCQLARNPFGMYYGK